MWHTEPFPVLEVNKYLFKIKCLQAFLSTALDQQMDFKGKLVLYAIPFPSSRYTITDDRIGQALIIFKSCRSVEMCHYL